MAGKASWAEHVKKQELSHGFKGEINVLHILKLKKVS
jgi:hypothetical protein